MLCISEIHSADRARVEQIHNIYPETVQCYALPVQICNILTGEYTLLLNKSTL